MTHKLVLGVGLALAVTCYVGLAARHLTLPGMYVDESTPLIGVGDRTESGVTPPRIPWPLMNGPYAGALKPYLLAVLFRLFGFRIEVLRLTAIAITAVGLVFAAMLTRRMLGGAPALAATWLLATDPSLILYTRTDWGPVAFGFTLRTALLYWLWRWWTGGGRTALILAGAAAGLGLWDKATFAWLLIPLLLAGIIVWFTARDRPALPISDAAWAIGAALVCSAPFWIYNIINPAVTVRIIARPDDPIGLSAVLNHSSTRTTALIAMFNGTATARWMFGASVPPVFGFSHTWLLPLSVIGGIVSVAGGLVTRRVWTWAIPLIGLAILAQIYATPRPVWVHHWITIYPLPQLAIGAALSFVGAIPSRLRTVRAGAASLAFGAVGGAILLNVLLMLGYHALMVQTGGRGLWSDAIYTVSDTIQRRYPDRGIRVMDWGIKNQLRLLSGGGLRLHGPYWAYAKQASDLRPLVALVRDPTNVFVLRAPGVRQSQASENLKAAARAACAEVMHTEQFVDRASRPVFILIEYRAGSCEDKR